MTISKNLYNNIYNYFLVLILSTIIFRKFCTIVIIIFILFNLFFSFKNFSLNKKNLLNILLISIPFLLEVVFFFKNDSFYQGIKSAEKTISLFIFPIILLANKNSINFEKIIKNYALVFVSLMIFFSFRFYFCHHELFNKFYHGNELWHLGYEFSNTIGVHAPALNMQISFVVIISFYLFLKTTIKKSSIFNIFCSLVLLISSFFYVLLINTRIALLCSFLGIGIISIFYLVKNINITKTIKGLSISLVLIAVTLFYFIKYDTFIKEKWTNQISNNLDKVGKLDEIDHPEIAVYSSLVTRLTIWKTTLDLSSKNLYTGVGSSDGKNELFKYYKETNQYFLAKYKFPVHNQFLDFLLKFGLLGLLGVLLYMLNVLRLGIKTNNPLIISFFILFFIVNIFDDFLIRFDGIIFSGTWISIFTVYYKKHIDSKLDYN